MDRLQTVWEVLYAVTLPWYVTGTLVLVNRDVNLVNGGSELLEVEQDTTLKEEEGFLS